MSTPELRGARQGVQQIVVGISEMKVTARPTDVLVTYSLGSCIGLSLFDPVAGVGGMLHSLMPIARKHPVEAARTPCKFTDTGVAALLVRLLNMGALRKNLVARIAGGAAMFDADGGVFNIGRQNHVVVRKMLWRNDVLVVGEAVGGLSPRTLRLYMETGITTTATGATETAF